MWPDALSGCVYAGEASAEARLGGSEDTGACSCVCNVISISRVANPIREPKRGTASLWVANRPQCN